MNGLPAFLFVQLQWPRLVSAMIACVLSPMWKSRDPKSRSNGTVAAEACAAATRMHPNGLPWGEPELKSRRARLASGPILPRVF